MMSGRIEIAANAGQSAAATAHGGLLVVRGDAARARGDLAQGRDVVVGGSVGHAAAFMAQSGRLVVCGDAGEALGDSIYEARVYVAGTVASLGADCIEKPIRAEHLEELTALLEAAQIDADRPRRFVATGRPRTLYHFHART